MKKNIVVVIALVCAVIFAFGCGVKRVSTRPPQQIRIQTNQPETAQPAVAAQPVKAGEQVRLVSQQTTQQQEPTAPAPQQTEPEKPQEPPAPTAPETQEQQMELEKESSQAAQAREEQKTTEISGELFIFEPLPSEKSNIDNEHMQAALDALTTAPNAVQFRQDYEKAASRPEQEIIVLRYKPDAATAPVPPKQWKPEEVQVLNDPAEIPDVSEWRVYRRWNVDPIIPREKQTSENRIQKIEDLKPYLSNISARIDSPVVNYSPEVKDEWKTKLQNAVNGIGGDEGGYAQQVTIYDYTRFWEFMMGGHTVSPPKLHYVPDPEWRAAQGVCLFLSKAGLHVCHGFPCYGNPFVPIQRRLYRWRVVTRAPRPQYELNCKIHATKTALTSKADESVVSVDVFRDGKPYVLDFSNPLLGVDWYLDSNRIGANTASQTVTGNMLGNVGGPYRVLSRITVGTQQTECSVDLSLSEPLPPTPPKTLPPSALTQKCPTCPCPTCPPVKPTKEVKKKFPKWVLIPLIAGAAIGACYAAGCFSHETVVRPPTKTFPIGGASFGGVRFSFGSRQ